MQVIAIGNGRFVRRKEFVKEYGLQRAIVYFILFFTLVMETIIAVVPGLSVIRYINDFALVVLLLASGLKFVKTFKNIRCKPVLTAVAFFIFSCLVSTIINLVPINLVVWGTRNTFRGIIYLIFAVTYLDGEDLKIIFKVLFYVQIVNFVLALYQYFVLGYKQDFLGGIFGYGNGAGVNTFNILLLAYYFNAYIAKKESGFKVLFVTLTVLIISALAEEKMTFVFYFVVVVATVLINKSSARKFTITVASLTCFAGGFALFYAVFPRAAETFFNFEKFIGYSKKIGGGFNIPRLGAFSFISENIFNGDPIKILFGCGLGNCDTSSFSIFQSAFFNEYGHYNYRWFVHQWVFLECGLFGFIAYLSIFVTALVCVIKSRSRCDEGAKLFNNTGIITGLYCIAVIWYNGTLKFDMCYVAFFALAVGLISLKKSVTVKKVDKGESLY